jgi:hypothetical protein
MERGQGVECIHQEVPAGKSWHIQREIIPDRCIFKVRRMQGYLERWCRKPGLAKWSLTSLQGPWDWRRE